MDRVYISISQFVQGQMGTQFVQPPVFTYNDIFEQSTPNTPIIFILSPGADPANDVIKLADKLGNFRILYFHIVTHFNYFIIIPGNFYN